MNSRLFCLLICVFASQLQCRTDPITSLPCGVRGVYFCGFILMIIFCRINGKHSFLPPTVLSVLQKQPSYKQIYRNSSTPLPGDANTKAQFIVPDWGGKIDYCIGLSCRPVWLHRLAGQYDNPMP
jgi:hypothetical protein